MEKIVLFENNEKRTEMHLDYLKSYGYIVAIDTIKYEVMGGTVYEVRVPKSRKFLYSIKCSRKSVKNEKMCEKFMVEYANNYKGE